MADVKSASLDKGFQNKKLKIIMISNIAEVLCTLQATTNFYFENACQMGAQSLQVKRCKHVPIKSFREKRKIIND